MAALVVFALALADRLWRFAAVERFFRREHATPPGAQVRRAALVSVIQPILSGDPTLSESLGSSLDAVNHCRTEVIWLLDSDDQEAREVCAGLQQRYSGLSIKILLSDRPAEDVNPKTRKLIAGAAGAAGDYLCVLDDDTRLRTGDLDTALLALASPDAGLAFGLPYYVNNSSLWSSLTAAFVCLNSLTTYIPYLSFSEPLTINGMFYVVRRAAFDSLGGFNGLEDYVADDFAVAQRIRDSGLRLVQTTICHAVSTTVPDCNSYLRIMHRWLMFPRESLLRQLRLTQRLLVAAVAAPAFPPLLLLAMSFLRPHAMGILGFSCLVMADIVALRVFSSRHFHDQAPRACHWLAPVSRIVVPLHLLFALILPQRIVWRGRRIRIARGGRIDKREQ